MKKNAAACVLAIYLFLQLQACTKKSGTPRIPEPACVVDSVFDNSNTDAAYEILKGRWISVETLETFDHLPGDTPFHYEFRTVLDDENKDTVVFNADRTYRSCVGMAGTCYGAGRFHIDSSRKLTMQSTSWCEKSTCPGYVIERRNFSVKKDSMVWYHSWEYNEQLRSTTVKLVRR
ncbi:MAG: hypothetical protein JNL13_12190 [Chitinophagaceae bacterium]|nr:hypothetical protein [Chitinophagaceae bacterium]